MKTVDLEELKEQIVEKYNLRSSMSGADRLPLIVKEAMELAVEKDRQIRDERVREVLNEAQKYTMSHAASPEMCEKIQNLLTELQ